MSFQMISTDLSYQQPQVCRGCLVGVLMRQLSQVSTQSLQAQPRPQPEPERPNSVQQ